MYRVLAIILMAYAICFPRVVTQASAGAMAYGSAPSRAERLAEDFSAWLRGPLDGIMARLGAPPAGKLPPG